MNNFDHDHHQSHVQEIHLDCTPWSTWVEELHYCCKTIKELHSCIWQVPLTVHRHTCLSQISDVTPFYFVVVHIARSALFFITSCFPYLLFNMYSILFGLYWESSMFPVFTFRKLSEIYLNCDVFWLSHCPQYTPSIVCFF